MKSEDDAQALEEVERVGDSRSGGSGGCVDLGGTEAGGVPGMV